MFFSNVHAEKVGNKKKNVKTLHEQKKKGGGG
jgi:hypothetical protein